MWRKAHHGGHKWNNKQHQPQQLPRRTTELTTTYRVCGGIKENWLQNYQYFTGKILSLMHSSSWRSLLPHSFTHTVSHTFRYSPPHSFTYSSEWGMSVRRSEGGSSECFTHSLIPSVTRPSLTPHSFTHSSLIPSLIYSTQSNSLPLIPTVMPYPLLQSFWFTPSVSPSTVLYSPSHSTH